MIKAHFKALCPNCGGDITADRLELGLPCEKCMPIIQESYCGNLKETGQLQKICKMETELREWESFFQSFIKSKPWSLQVSWAKRVFLGHSFALLAPTGVGKSSFGLTMAGYLAKKGLRSYIILPTVVLVEQVVDKLTKMGLGEDEILFFADDSPSQKEKKKKRLSSFDFKILVTTSMFLYKNQALMPKDFHFIFVDDVDSFLKTAKNIDKVLYLLGFDDGDLKLAFNLIKLKAKAKAGEEIFEKIKTLQEELKQIIQQKCRGVLVVSSATSNPKSSRIKLFRELLGFEVGTPTFYLRNILDLYSDDEKESLENWIRKLGKGGLVFVSSDKGKDFVDVVVNRLNQAGIRAISYEDLNEQTVKEFEEQKVDVLVGIGSYRNPLARGVDLPHAIRYAIFYGVPKIVISLNFEENLTHLLWALTSLRSLIAKKFPQRLREIDTWLDQLKRYQFTKEETPVETPETIQKFINLRKTVGEFLTSKEILEFIESSDELTLRHTDGEYEMVVSDVAGYLQASGRTSRMFVGGISKGLSLILVDDERAFKHLTKKVKWFNDEINFLHVREVNLQEVLEEVDRDREKIRKFMRGEEIPENKELLKPVLMIVESPNKARTIANFFGRPIRRRIGSHELLETSVEDHYLLITASLGHILDLNKEEGFHGVIVGEQLIPIYETIEGKEELIQSLRRMAVEAREVLVATDPDTEGEKIGWDLKELLSPFNKNIKRMEFHEVTKRAILKALREPRSFDLNLVKAQIVRRVADRWVGFEFSQYIQAYSRNPKLSAGRVQTPVLGWIIEREKEFLKRVFKVIVYVSEDKKLKVEWTFENFRNAKAFFDNLKTFKVEALEEKEETKNPPPPFSTDTMLKSASDHYRWPLYKTMDLAQTLFETGLITYHRTDSTRVSDFGINVAREFITQEFSPEFFHPRTWGEGGAHECIRPTRALDPEELKALVLSGQVEGINREHLLLYELIFKQFMASQMRPVKLKVLKVRVSAQGKSQEVEVPVQILEDGWNKLLKAEVHTPILGEQPAETFKELRSYPKALRYTHGELVQEMKRRGIGRPSTYAVTIEKLLERGYVAEEKGFLKPTPLGQRVYYYLTRKEKARQFLSEEFTRELEALMDKVEEGKADYTEILFNLEKEIRSALS